MDFSYGGGSQSVGNAQVQIGPDLEETQTDGLGFLGLGVGQAKLQLLPIPWPANSLPPPTASLMSVASRKSLVAAAGPNAVIIASTESVRKAFEGPKSGESGIRPFQPQLTLPMPMRISQVAFTSDEKFLLLSAEEGGGLAVYDVQSLVSGSTQSTFEMSTSSLALRALVPNPTTEQGEIIAIVTSDGKLMIANLKEKNFASGASGPVLKDGVSCVAWSNRGKQLVAGLGDGSTFQLTPDGTVKAVIPRAPGIDPSLHVSSITWLENDMFLIIHSPSQASGDSTFPSVFHVVTRIRPSEFFFQKIGDPTPPYGLPRNPPYHFLLRLKKFPPKLQDLLIVASTASTDIGLFSRSAFNMVSDKPTDKDTGPFMMIQTDDTRRAQLSMTDDMTDTSPIGVVLDLSSTEKVYKPIPMDEMDESPSPAPALMVLNNEGVLTSWWVIYNESIKQGTIYPGMVANGALQSTKLAAIQQTPQFSGLGANSAISQPIFGSSASSMTALSGLKTTVPTFGSTTILGTNTTSAFGGPSALNQTSSPWARPVPTNAASSSTSFGAPASASTSAPNAQGLAFGSSAFPGNKISPWGSALAKATGGTPGQSGNFGSNQGRNGSSFGDGSAMIAPVSGGFASFANQGGFAAAAVSQNTRMDLFTQKAAMNSFTAPIPSSITDSDTSFSSNNVQDSEKAGGLFRGTGFKLESTFKPDGSAKDDGPRPLVSSGMSFFGNGFDATLGRTQNAPLGETPIAKEAEMKADKPESSHRPIDEESFAKKQAVPPAEESAMSTTPMSTPALKLKFPDGASSVTAGILSTSLSSEIPPTTKESTKIADFSFGTPSTSTHKSPGDSLKHSPLVPAPVSSEATQIKQEPQSDEEVSKRISTVPEAPLPPDPTSKISFAIGESSVSSVEPDAPLPPDFMTGAGSKSGDKSKLPLPDKSKEEATFLPENLTGPAEGHDSDFGTENEGDMSDVGSEGSGDDVAEDISPTSEIHQTPSFTPQSSFVGVTHRGIGEGFFKVPQPSQGPNSRALFGEIDGRAAPIIPPPQSFPSPRSPSPIRGSIPSKLLRPDTSRSVSAPGFASRLLGSQKPLTERSITPSDGSSKLALETKMAGKRSQIELTASMEAAEAQALIDEDDESMKRFLQQEIVGTKILAEFIAHQDYVGNADKDSIPAQVEAVYRDINSMIDTLGINSCSLKSFIRGHELFNKEAGRTLKDLEDDEEWCLIEMKDISTIIEQDLTEILTQGRVKDAANKLLACADLERDLAKLRPKHADIKTLMASHLDPDHMSMARSQPLKGEQALQQHDLRRDFANFQKLLAEAEESVIILRTKLATQGNSDGKAHPVPTVEAVMRTISKMTSKAERCSGDVDVLETQMRKLRLSPTATNGGREASPFATPTAKVSLLSKGFEGTISTNGLFQTPDRSREDPRRFQNSLSSSTYSPSRPTPPRRKLNGFKEEDRIRLKREGVRRREVTEKLKAALRKSGVRVRPVNID